MVANSLQLSFTCHFRRSGPWLRGLWPGWCGVAAGRSGVAVVVGRRAYLAGMNDATIPSAMPDGSGLEPLLTVQELSDYLGIPVTTLYDWRVDGIGPKAVKLGRALRYPQSAVRLWIQEQADA